MNDIKTAEQAKEALKHVTDPGTGRDIVSAGMVSGLQVENGHVLFALEVDTAMGSALEPLRQQAEKAVSGLRGVRQVTAVLTAKKSNDDNPVKTKTARIENLAPGIKHIIAVASGKGGVGKSTVAVNLAVSLSRLGVKTGLMDADIYGPSVPHMMGLSGKPDLKDGKLRPLEAHGVKFVSMGLMVDPEAAMIWRGPMIQSAIRQFLADVNWGDLDVLVVDMPPGTGDAQLTLAQKVPLAGAVIVSTPQDIALLDARRAITMFRQVKVPVLGLVENMSSFVCPRCSHEEHIFGEQGARREAEKLGVAFLGEIPLDIKLREAGDQGKPLADERFKTIAAAVKDELFLKEKTKSAPAP